MKAIRTLFLFFLLCNAYSLWASHIAGGGIELVHIGGNRYRISLIVYFDVINGNEGARDPSVTVSVYGKRGDLFIQNITLPLQEESRVGYTLEECSEGELITDRLLYQSEITLDPLTYNDIEGYYMSWQRCCRNYGISNIFSENPDRPEAISAGQTFYIEFPPVIRFGVPFRNSSPSVGSILNDYACPGMPYYADLRGTDIDKDSLVYKIVTPFSTNVIQALPPPTPRPYNLVQWKGDFSINNIIGGNPDISISPQGIITTTPQFEGLYSFAVEVSEYRNKELIGVTVRDYQMLVLDICGISVPPVITGPANVNLALNDNEAARCIMVTVSDDDSRSPGHNFTENVSIRVIALDNGHVLLRDFFPSQQFTTLNNGSTVDYSICIPECPPFGDSPYRIGIIAMDDACSVPLLDTLKVTINAEVPPNTRPYFTTPVLREVSYEQDVNPDQGLSLSFTAQDDDRVMGVYEPLTVVVNPQNFNMDQVGMSVTWAQDPLTGIVRGNLSWQPSCDNRLLHIQNPSLMLSLQVDDKDRCELNDAVTLNMVFNLIFDNNNSPNIDTDLTLNPAEEEVQVERKLYESLVFNVTATDLIDNSPIILDFIGSKALDITTTSELNARGISFSRAEGIGLVSSLFSMDINCAHIVSDVTPHIIDFKFLAIDSPPEWCSNQGKTDTLTVWLNVLPRDNTPPTITIIDESTGDILDPSQPYAATVGKPIIWKLEGIDTDINPQNFVELEYVEEDGGLSLNQRNVSFTTRGGVGYATANFEWMPICGSLQNNLESKIYTVKFRVKDNQCLNMKEMSSSILLSVSDIENQNFNFIPFNFVSPNGDEKNDNYSMVAFNAKTGERENALPQDNCQSYFQSVHIFNRWGKEIYISADRDFVWQINRTTSAGIYYYIIQYSDKIYKGDLTIRY